MRLPPSFHFLPRRGGEGGGGVRRLLRSCCLLSQHEILLREVHEDAGPPREDDVELLPAVALFENGRAAGAEPALAKLF